MRLYRAVKLLLLGLGGLAVAALALLAWLLLTPSGTRSLLRSAEWLAGKAGVELQLGDISGSVAGGLQLRGLRYGSDAALQLSVARFDFAWQPWQLLQGRLSIERIVVEDLLLQTHGGAETASEPFDAHSISGWFELLPWQIELGGLHARNLRFDIDGSETVIPALDLAASVDAQALELRELSLAILQAELQVPSLRLQQDLALQGSLDWSWLQGEERYAGSATLGGSLLQLQLQHDLQQPAQLHSAGELFTGLDPAQPLQLDLRHNLAALDLAQWGQPDLQLAGLELLTQGGLDALRLQLGVQLQYQDFAPLQLQALAVYGPQQVQLEQFAADSDELALQAAGSWTFATESLALDWQLLRLDLERAGLRLEQVAGSGTVALQLTAEGVDAQLQLGPVQGELNGQALALEAELELLASVPERLDVNLGSGPNSLRLQGNLQPELALEWDLQAPTLAQLYSGLGGELSGRGSVLGTLEAPQLRGDLRGTALSFSQDGRQLSLARLQLDADARQNGDNQLQLQLESLVLQQGGDAQTLLQGAQFELAGRPEEHRASLQLDGMDLQLELALSGALEGQDWRGRIGSASLGTPVGDWRLQQGFALSWAEARLQVERHCWNAAPMALCLAASQSAAGYSGQLQLSGLPLHWLNRSGDAPDKPARLQQLQSGWGFDLPPGLALQGQMGLVADLTNWNGELPEALRAELQLQDLVLQVSREIEPEDGEDLVQESRRFGIAAEPLQLTRQAGRWQLRSDLAVSQQPDEPADDAAAQAAVFQGSLGADLSLDDAGNLGGSLQLGFADLAFVESLVPALQQPAGRLQGRANFGGTLQAPRIDADVRVNEASFAVPALGIDVRDVGATLRSSNDNLLLQASAVSGEGELLLQAEVLRPLESSRELRARLEGSDFSLLAREDLQATISPALDLSFTEAALTLQGSVRVPRALIGLESLLADVSNGGVDVSRDVVVVQADTQALVAEQQRALPFNARLDLQLGDDVQLRGFGLDATLNGELRVEQEAGRPLLAYGELGMPRATYRIYSQELNARDGRLLFYGNPLNPSLDVRAFRETPSAEVGMLLSGTLGRIQSRLYSTPTLPENEILAILVTGKSFNDMNDQDGNALLNAVANFGIERGEGLTSAIGDKLGLDTVAINGGASYLDSSLGLGKYITPDLLLRYEIGLFDRQAVLSIDYALTERLRLEVRSGLSQSVDISYTIEKD